MNLLLTIDDKVEGVRADDVVALLRLLCLSGGAVQVSIDGRNHSPHYVRLDHREGGGFYISATLKEEE